MDAKEKNYMTPTCHAKLVAEHDQLLKGERPEVVKVIQWAAGNGDRSENADYIYGKRRLREIDKRLRFLSRRLDLAVVVDPASNGGKSTIQFGATVTVEDETGASRRVSIIGVDEVDTTKGHISWRSPIGSALLGKKVGDSVSIHTPGGEVELEIIQVEYLPLSK